MGLSCLERIASIRRQLYGRWQTSALALTDASMRTWVYRIAHDAASSYAIRRRSSAAPPGCYRGGSLVSRKFTTALNICCRVEPWDSQWSSCGTLINCTDLPAGQSLPFTRSGKMARRCHRAHGPQIAGRAASTLPIYGWRFWADCTGCSGPTRPPGGKQTVTGARLPLGPRPALRGPLVRGAARGTDPLCAGGLRQRCRLAPARACALLAGEGRHRPAHPAGCHLPAGGCARVPDAAGARASARLGQGPVALARGHEPVAVALCTAGPGCAMGV